MRLISNNGLLFLEDGDPELRLGYCQRLVEEYGENENILDNILWSDEKYFGRKGIYNQHNEHYWAHENPHLTKPRNK